MNLLVSTKILLILAVWFLSGCLSFADTFDLTDEFQNSLPSQVQALEPDLDEVRETVEDGPAPVTYIFPLITNRTSCFHDVVICADAPVPEATRPRHEVLRVFRI
jgi:outer membrane murein-binding lipoprotein Lpp